MLKVREINLFFLFNNNVYYSCSISFYKEKDNNVICHGCCRVVNAIHCMKSVQIGSFFWSVLFRTRAEYWPDKTPYLDTFHTVIINYLWLLRSQYLRLHSKYLPCLIVFHNWIVICLQFHIKAHSVSTSSVGETSIAK